MSNKAPCSQDVPSSPASELQTCVTAYEALQSRHATLDACLPRCPEATGMIYEMAGLEREREALKEKTRSVIGLLMASTPEHALIERCRQLGII